MLLQGKTRCIAMVVGLLCALLPAAVQATDVSGGLYENTTWSAANSPYHVVGNVVLFPGYTLTVEPDVTVVFDAGTSLAIRGTLAATGTADDRIVFTSFAAPSLWAGIALATNQGGHGRFAYCDFSYASTAVSVECCWGHSQPAEFDHCTFSNNTTALGGYAGSVEHVTNSTFDNNTYGAKQADKNFADCVFTNNEYGLYSTERISASSCTFSNNTTGAYGGRGMLDRCTFTGNGTGIKGFFEGFTVMSSCVSNNGTGIVLSSYGNAVGNVELCDIFENSVYNVNIGTVSTNVDMTNNWWGTTNPAQIDASIYDGYDDPNRGLVLYTPFSSEPYVCGNSTPVQPATWGGIKALYHR